MTPMIQCGPDDDLAGWRETIARLPDDGAALPEVAASRERCRAARLDPGAAALRRVDDEEFVARVRASEDLLVAAIPHLRWLDALAAGVEHVVYLTDADGIVLCSMGTPEAMVDEYGLRPGADGSETAMGTNGAGTALVGGRPVVVRGEEHYCRRWHGATCAAAPVRDPSGRVVGAIDLSTAAPDWRPAHLVAVAHVSFAVARELAGRRARARARQIDDALRVAREVAMAGGLHDLRSAMASAVFQLQVVRRAAIEDGEHFSPAWAAARLERSTEIVLGAVGRMDALVEACGPPGLRAEKKP